VIVFDAKDSAYRRRTFRPSDRLPSLPATTGGHLLIGSDHPLHLRITFDHEIRTIRAGNWSELIERRKSSQK
jgi:hypothetical protein